MMQRPPKRPTKKVTFFKEATQIEFKLTHFETSIEYICENKLKQVLVPTQQHHREKRSTSILTLISQYLVSYLESSIHHDLQKNAAIGSLI